MGAMEYVRTAYSVPAKRGATVTYFGGSYKPRTGKITSAKGGRITGTNLDWKSIDTMGKTSKIIPFEKGSKEFEKMLEDLDLSIEKLEEFWGRPQYSVRSTIRKAEEKGVFPTSLYQSVMIWKRMKEMA